MTNILCSLFCAWLAIGLLTMEARSPMGYGSRSFQGQTAAFTRSCGTCHTAERILANRRSREAWDHVIESMLSKGARVTDDDYEPLMSYLLRQAGRVNVNSAAAYDLVDVLGIPEEQAASIVNYRTAHGSFPDFKALTRVPELDIKKVEQQLDAISFQDPSREEVTQ